MLRQTQRLSPEEISSYPVMKRSAGASAQHRQLRLGRSDDYGEHRRLRSTRYDCSDRSNSRKSQDRSTPERGVVTPVLLLAMRVHCDRVLAAQVSTQVRPGSPPTTFRAGPCIPEHGSADEKARRGGAGRASRGSLEASPSTIPAVPMVVMPMVALVAMVSMPAAMPLRVVPARRMGRRGQGQEAQCHQRRCAKLTKPLQDQLLQRLPGVAGAMLGRAVCPACVRSGLSRYR